MTEAYVFSMGQRALVLFLELAGPVLLFSLVTGLLVSIIQAVTQIQDMTLTFIPKILATLLAVVIFGPWMLKVVVYFTYNIIVSIPNLAK